MRSSRVAKTDYIRARVEPTLKQEVENVFDSLGITTTQAITMFYKQVQAKHGLPFEWKPNRETLRAMKEAKQGKGLVRCKNAEDLFDQLGI
ncbi:MAG: type II toxin-antitoxin system RelB/DinJ family antitoxin [Gammaproteobacteria bacterium]|jgi:DNA-damage-inducible protein J